MISTSAWSFAEDERDNVPATIEDVQTKEGASEETSDGSMNDDAIGGEDASDDRTEDAEPTEAAGEGDVSGEETEPEEPAKEPEKPLVEAPAKVSALIGYKSIKVRWSRVNGARGYMVYASRSARKPVKPVFRTYNKLS